MNKIISRIAQIIENNNISIGAFERNIGASKGVLSRAIANNTDIQSKWIETIVENFPEISPEWLLTGKGSMLKSPDDKIELSNNSIINSGSHNTITNNQIISDLLSAIKKRDEQIDRLILIIEKKQV